MSKNLVFLNHSHPEEPTEEDFKSHFNLFEANFAVRLAKYLIQQGYTHDKVTKFVNFKLKFMYYFRSQSFVLTWISCFNYANLPPIFLAKITTFELKMWTTIKAKNVKSSFYHWSEVQIPTVLAI